MSEDLGAFVTQFRVKGENIADVFCHRILVQSAASLRNLAVEFPAEGLDERKAFFGKSIQLGSLFPCGFFKQGTHADVELIKTQGLSIKIDEVRELITRASWAPSVANYRVVVIEDADRLTDSAANALLKVIEEPGLRTIWLLCAPTLTDVLPTIRSRCRHLSLRTPSTKAITNLLIERDAVDAKTAEFVARASGGHIGRARRLATDANARQNRANILKLPLMIKDIASAFKAAQLLVDAAKADALTDAEKKDEDEISKLKEAWGATGSKMASGGSKAVKELEKEQKLRSTEWSEIT